MPVNMYLFLYILPCYLHRGISLLCEGKANCLTSHVCTFQVTFSEPSSYIGATASEFEEEPVQGRKVSKVVKTMVVQGERMEKLIGDPSLSSDLPSAKDDFEKV